MKNIPSTSTSTSTSPSQSQLQDLTKYLTKFYNYQLNDKSLTDHEKNKLNNLINNPYNYFNNKELKIDDGYPQAHYNNGYLYAIQLRNISDPNLLIGCGNSPIIGQYNNSKHVHNGYTTVDNNPAMNPTIISNFGFNNIYLGFIGDDTFDKVFYEGLSPGPDPSIYTEIKRLTKKNTTDIYRLHDLQLIVLPPPQQLSPPPQQLSPPPQQLSPPPQQLSPPPQQ